MDILCTICNDSLNTSTDTYSTPCGHIFHHICLTQWIRESRTCPQCRQQATEKSIHKIYFNKANEPEEKDDISLQCKYDDLQFQLKLKQMDVKKYKDKYIEMESQNRGLKNECKTIQTELTSANSIVIALKDKLGYFKERSKERDKLANENQKLKEQLKNLDDIQLLLSGSTSDVDEMLRENNNLETLCLLVTTLKKELMKVNRKKKHLDSLLKEAQGELSHSKNDIFKLNNEIQKLRQEVQSSKDNETERLYLKQKIRDLVTNKGDEDDLVNMENNKTLERVIFESPAPLQKQHKFNILEEDKGPQTLDSPSIDERVEDIKNSESPYLLVKSNSLGYFNFNNAKSLNSVNKHSIFRSQSMMVPKAKKPQGSYDGMGWYTKEEHEPSSPHRKDNNKVGTKRHESSSSSSSKDTLKKRKVAPLRKLDGFFKN